jgi:CO/xanthine dehydrogenase FAD-binding subunit
MVKHYIPTNLVEALEFIYNNTTKIIAGGTDLMVQRRNWSETPAVFENKVMYIANLEELNYIKKIDDHLHIGAVTPLTDILNHKDTPRMLKDAIEIMASPAIRNCATIAGNIGNASPAGDTLPVLYVYEALIVLETNNKSRILSIDEIITGPRKTVIMENELITEIIIPLTNFSEILFEKVGGRKADAISKVSFAGAIILKDNKIRSLRIAYGAVGPTVVRDKAIEEKYINLTRQELKSKIYDLKIDYINIVNPIDDQRSNKEYRHKVAINLLEKFIDAI